MTKNKGLIFALCAQASISAASSSAALADVFSARVVAGVALISAMLSAGTAVYVALTGQPVTPAATPRT